MAIAKIRGVIDDPKGPGGTKLMLLDDAKVGDEQLSAVDAATRATLLDEEKLEVVRHELTLDHTHVSYEQILSQLLPAGVTVPTGYEMVGHLVHLNLREEHEPHKALIGQVLLDKSPPAVRTVLTKIGTISNEFRVFDMEVIAGDDDTECELRQNGCRFRFDFRQIYWNSRLDTEHRRLVDLIDNDGIARRKRVVVADMMAGVGPFAVPLAKRGVRVFANDLNPNSAKYLESNAKLNSADVAVHNMDGREFMRMLAREHPDVRVDHVIMNLPASAVQFLDIFPAVFEHYAAEELPTIHCYTFSKVPEDYKAEAVRLCREHVGGDMVDVRVHDVRDVAPSKHMMCVSFRAVPHRKRDTDAEGDERAPKKAKDDSAQ